VIVAVYRLQKRHPDAGEFRIRSLLTRSDLSVRTVGRIMALNKRVYDDIPLCARKAGRKGESYLNESGNRLRPWPPYTRATLSRMYD
jgi:hypothetical protein